MARTTNQSFNKIKNIDIYESQQSKIFAKTLVVSRSNWLRDIGNDKSSQGRIH